MYVAKENVLTSSLFVAKRHTKNGNLVCSVFLVVNLLTSTYLVSDSLRITRNVVVVANLCGISPIFSRYIDIQTIYLAYSLT